jgi:alkylated DNA repair protein alkB family protein 8
MSIEELHVKNVYNKIAKEFSNTRYRPWTCVEKFLNNIESNSIIADIGCGNGKNMNYRKDCNFYGCDFSYELVQICLKKKLNVIEGDILNIPYKDNFSDYTICIAVIHHLSTKEMRLKAIEELVRITKSSGEIFILCWAMKQDTDSKRKFTEQENYIDFCDKSKKILGKRYYYIFQNQELESLLPKNVEIIKSLYERGNYGIIIKKL